MFNCLNSQDSTGLTEVLKTAVKQLSEDMDMRQKCHEMANRFMTHRQVGESEAIYKLLANMKMTYSSIATIYVPTEPKSQRRHFLQRQDPDSGLGFEVEDKKGRFLEKPDLISKYERRKLLPSREEEEETLVLDNGDAETLENMSFCQFVKMYEGKGWQDMRKTNEEGETEEPDDDEEKPEEGELAQEDDFNYLIVGNSKVKRRKLPHLLTLEDVMPGEPRILHKRTFPRAMRFFKKKFDRNPHLFYFTELVLYHPFRDENELFPDDPEKCEELYKKHKDEIKYVKAQLMPFLESVEEAQLMYEEMRANEKRDIEEQMGADLDPEMEQEIADIDDLDDEDHPDYIHLDTDQVEDNTVGEVRPRRVFKTVALPSKDAQVTDLIMYFGRFVNVFLSGRGSKAAGHKAKGGAVHGCQLCKEGRHLPLGLPQPAPVQALSTPGHGSWWRRKWQVETHQLHLQHHDGHLQEGRR